MEKKTNSVMGHSIQIVEKEKIEVTGVLEIVSSTEKEIILKLESEMLHIFGSGLAVQKLSPEEKLVLASGKVSGLKYSGRLTKKTLFQKVFR